MGRALCDGGAADGGMAVIITPTKLEGVYEVWPELLEDERGAFARTSCVDEFARLGLPAGWTQCSISWNIVKHTLRGMHYQAEPHGEHKLVRCTAGRILDVALDLRSNSRTRLQWHALELSAVNRAALYIPPGVAHGFLTLEDGSEVFYQIQGAYHPESARGVRWNDSAFAVNWPAAPSRISRRDAEYPLL